MSILWSVLIRVHPFRGYNSAQATLWLFVRFLINSLSPTFSIFLTFIFYSLVFFLTCTHLAHILYSSYIYLLYLSFSILRYLRIFSYLFSTLSRPCRTPNLPHSPLSHRSLTVLYICMYMTC